MDKKVSTGKWRKSCKLKLKNFAQKNTKMHMEKVII